MTDQKKEMQDFDDYMSILTLALSGHCSKEQRDQYFALREKMRKGMREATREFLENPELHNQLEKYLASGKPGDWIFQAHPVDVEKQHLTIARGKNRQSKENKYNFSELTFDSFAAWVQPAFIGPFPDRAEADEKLQADGSNDDLREDDVVLWMWRNGYITATDPELRTLDINGWPYQVIANDVHYNKERWTTFREWRRDFEEGMRMSLEISEILKSPSLALTSTEGHVNNGTPQVFWLSTVGKEPIRVRLVSLYPTKKGRINVRRNFYTDEYPRTVVFRPETPVHLIEVLALRERLVNEGTLKFDDSFRGAYALTSTGYPASAGEIYIPSTDTTMIAIEVQRRHHPLSWLP